MNDLVTLNGDTAVTSTLAIAEGTGNEHASIIKLVRAYLPELEQFGQVDFKSTRPERGGHDLEYALLNEQQATLLFTFMRNSAPVVQFKVRLVKAFYELAQKARNAGAALTRMDLIKMALESEQRALELEAEKLMLAADKVELECKIAADAPKVGFYERVAVAPGAITLAEAAKILGTGRTRLMASLRQMGWLRRNNEPYQDKIEAGLLDVKIGQWQHPDLGLQRSVTALITGKGLTKLQSLLKFEPAKRVASGDLYAHRH